MPDPDTPESVRLLAALLEGQREQIALGREGLAFAREADQAGAADLQALRDEARQQHEAAVRRDAFLVRLYGVLMVLVGALLATLWLDLFSH